MAEIKSKASWGQTVRWNIHKLADALTSFRICFWCLACRASISMFHSWLLPACRHFLQYAACLRSNSGRCAGQLASEGTSAWPSLSWSHGRVRPLYERPCHVWVSLWSACRTGSMISKRSSRGSRWSAPAPFAQFLRSSKRSGLIIDCPFSITFSQPVSQIVSVVVFAWIIFISYFWLYSFNNHIY